MFYQKRNLQKRSVGSGTKWIAGALLCVVLTGCGRTDQVLLIPEAGETIAEEFKKPAEENLSRENPAEGSVGTEQAVVCVHVCGAVNSPGVVSLPAGSRAKDALEAAGGFAENADREAVNLAGVVSDGQKLYFPTQDEEWTEETVLEKDSGLIDLNTADAALLCTLPGIGESRARAIIAYREENGRFGVIEDIMKVAGIKTAAFEKIKDLITVR